MKIKLFPLFASLTVSLGVGLLSSALTRGSVALYRTLTLPPLSPPSWVFPVVWTLLYILMGISAYLVYISDAPPTDKRRALGLYAVSLFLNFGWSIIFFNFQAYTLSFVWLCILWLSILLTIRAYAPINRTAALLQLPYLLWVTFAGYLNLWIALNN